MTQETSVSQCVKKKKEIVFFHAILIIWYN
jgi:hypothetical protein